MKTLASHILVMILSGILIFCAVGCNQPSEATMPEAIPSPAGDRTAATDEMQSNETAAANEQEPSVSPFGEDYEIVITMEGEVIGEYDLDFQVGPIVIGTPLTEIVTLLGQPEKEEKAQYQGYDGDWHRSVSYESKGISLQVSATEEKGEYTVERVSVTEPFSGKTAKGIGIGSSPDEIRAAYSDMMNPDDSSEVAVVLGSVYWGVHFHLGSEGTVESITFGANAE